MHEDGNRLLIETGARPRTLPGSERFDNVHVLRSALDSARLRERLRPGARLVIVGAGIIGLEVAAPARSLGVEVTVLDAAAAPLLRIVGPQLAAWFADMHRDEGVRLLLEAGIEGLRAEGDEIRAIRLSDGDCLHMAPRAFAMPDTAVVVGTAPPQQSWPRPRHARRSRSRSSTTTPGRRSSLVPGGRTSVWIRMPVSARG
ncbi:MAG: NAD(P)/FAD-dependent oxidoreductase [Actinomycetota bacterium]|nr:NAD(P)/FAD-dependent oxidoreductase [Actinomycetota bacterium]